MAKATPALSTEIISNPAIAAAAADIHTLINSMPRSPTKDELAGIIAKVALRASDASVPKLRAERDALAAEIRAALSPENAAVAACGELLGPAFDRAEALLEKCSEELRALASQIPSPPRTFDDLALMAEVAFHYADHDVDGRMEELDDDDLFHASAARLIEAVLEFARTIAPPAAFPALSLEHLKYRKLVAELQRYDDPDCMPDNEETDAVMSRLQELSIRLWSCA